MLKAYVDDVRIYNYALNEEEVKEAMNAATGIKAPETTPIPEGAPLYGVDGIRVSKHHKGIVVSKKTKTIDN